MSQSRRPNILVFMSDQHSRHFVGCYGNRIIRTPNLDRLAAEGMRFDNAYCPAPLCVPSRMSFMTCRTPTRNRVWNNLGCLNSGIPTWAHVLGLSGYETLLFGRMHFNGPDQHHGLEHRPVGHVHSTHYGVPLPGAKMWGKIDGGACGQLRIAVEAAGVGQANYKYLDDQATSAACDWLRGQGRQGGRPFAAVVGTMLPHCPFIAPKSLYDYYFERADLPTIEASQPESIQRFRRTRDILRPLSDHQVRVARAAYYALCEYADSAVGRVLEALAAGGLDRDTLVIYTSDHGEAAGEHGCWWKSNYYEASAGVPLIARLPGVVQSGSVQPAICNLMDIGATLVDVAGPPSDAVTASGATACNDADAGGFPCPVDGRSLWPMLQGNAAIWPNETFSELVDFRSGRFATRMIRRDQWKLWVSDGGAGRPADMAMFNLDKDPGELTDLSGDPAVADIRTDLLARLYDGWSPADALAACELNRTDMQFLARHGRAFKPRHPCAPTLPEGYEEFEQR